MVNHLFDGEQERYSVNRWRFDDHRVSEDLEMHVGDRHEIKVSLMIATDLHFFC